jgi:hypothetical protein
MRKLRKYTFKNRELKISDKEVAHLRAAYNKGASMGDLAIVYDISYPYVRDIVLHYRRNT